MYPACLTIDKYDLFISEVKLEGLPIAVCHYTAALMSVASTDASTDASTVALTAHSTIASIAQLIVTSIVHC